MGVTRNEKAAPLFRPERKLFFRFVLALIIFGSAGGIQNAEMLQRFPQIAHHQAGEPPQIAVEKISLMAVNQIEIAVAFRILEDEPGVMLDCRKADRSRVLVHLIVIAV